VTTDPTRARLTALVLLHHPSLAACAAALDHHPRWLTRRLTPTRGNSPVRLAVEDVAAILAHLGETLERLHGTAPILAPGDRGLLTYLSTPRSRRAALQRHTAAEIGRLEVQGYLTLGDVVQLTAEGEALAIRLAGGDPATP
jgi:hypothetical protein